MTSSTTTVEKKQSCKCLKSEACLNPCQKEEPAYIRGPAPKRLHGKCPALHAPGKCEGHKCRFIKKGCVYSRVKENEHLTRSVLNVLVLEGMLHNVS